MLGMAPVESGNALQATTLNRILVPLDGSPRAERILPSVHRLAAATGAKVTLLQICRAPAPSLELARSTLIGKDENAAPTSEDSEERRARHEAAQRLASLVEMLKVRGISADYEVVYGDTSQPGEFIVDEAVGIGADLIAMTTHARTGLSRVLMGSVAEYVLRHSGCPLFLTYAG